MTIDSLQAATFAKQVYKANTYRTCNLGGFWICQVDNRIHIFNQNRRIGDFLEIDIRV